ncbi:MAG: class II fructose-bisphosphate aldolase [Armatimonadetes bacterium]|nr:class II fructose-bisphosphate aldolase [Armatimonadota bacterium]
MRHGVIHDKKGHDMTDIVLRAYQAGLVVPAFNVPYLSMVEPVIRAAADEGAFILIATARLEWIKFESKGLAPVLEEYRRWRKPGISGLHLDHVPVIDEDNLQVDYMPILEEAVRLGYHSVMVDGSRLDLEENIRATRKIAEMAHRAGVPCEAELGAVMGHEAGPPPPYEELFSSGMGFTDIAEAKRFADSAGCDWLSVAVGNIHGAVSGALKDRKKAQARLNLEHLEKLRLATGVPLVLHGGSGIRAEDIRAAARLGIAKVNVATEIRQAYEAAVRDSGDTAQAQKAVYERTRWLLRDYFGLSGTAARLTGQHEVSR